MGFTFDAAISSISDGAADSTLTAQCNTPLPSKSTKFMSALHPTQSLRSAPYLPSPTLRLLTPTTTRDVIFPVHSTKHPRRFCGFFFQAVSRGFTEAVRVLATSFPHLVLERDRRGRLPLDLVPPKKAKMRKAVDLQAALDVVKARQEEFMAHITREYRIALQHQSTQSPNSIRSFNFLLGLFA